MATIFRAIKKILPTADLIKLEKMPSQINGRDNPLTLLKGNRSSSLCQYGVSCEQDWDQYWAGLKRKVRKEQRRRWRNLEKQGEVSFKLVDDPHRAVELFDWLREQQHARLKQQGLKDIMDDPDIVAYYSELIRQGIKNKSVYCSTLSVDNELAATLIGVGNGHSFVMLLTAYKEGRWHSSAPGHLLFGRTMRELHGLGYRYFDFSIGKHRYKTEYGATENRLNEQMIALSLYGLPFVWYCKVKHIVRACRSNMAALKKPIIIKTQ